MKAMMVSTVAVNLIMAISLQMLWGLVNTLQIIAHLPMIELAMPQNAFIFFRTLTGLTQLEIIESGPIYEKLMTFDENEEALTSNFEQMGYETKTAILNMGPIFMYFCGIIAFMIIWKIISIVLRLFSM